MSQKELVLEAIQELPDDASIDQIADRVEFMAAIQKGIDDIDSGDTVPHEEIKKHLATWLTE
jgi:predicted transcriptional regulator